MSNIETKEQPVSNYEARLFELESALDNGKEKQTELIDSAMQKFDSESEPTTISLMQNKFVEGPINSQTEVKRSMIVDGFSVDDPEMYQTFLDTVQLFREQPGWKDLPFRAIIPTAIQYAVDRYFGYAKSGANPEMENREFYMDHSSADSEKVHLAELKEKGIAVCAEKAAAAQNLNSFAGLESYLITSSDSKLHGEDGPSEAHMYNILNTRNGYVLSDPANPTRYVNAGANTQAIRPSMFQISEEQFNNLKSGGAESFDQEDEYIIDGKIEKETTKRIYTGPK